MVHGKCCMAHGTWNMVYGAWCMEHCLWHMAHGTWCMVWYMVHGAWCMVVSLGYNCYGFYFFYYRTWPQGVCGFMCVHSETPMHSMVSRSSSDKTSTLYALRLTDSHFLFGLSVRRRGGVGVRVEGGGITTYRLLVNLYL
jgi:hypothetical protein